MALLALAFDELSVLLVLNCILAKHLKKRTGAVLPLLTKLFTTSLSRWLLNNWTDWHTLHLHSFKFLPESTALIPMVPTSIFKQSSETGFRCNYAHFIWPWNWKDWKELDFRRQLWRGEKNTSQKFTTKEFSDRNNTSGLFRLKCRICRKIVSEVRFLFYSLTFLTA